jgi:hypothetical protein
MEDNGLQHPIRKTEKTRPRRKRLFSRRVRPVLLLGAALIVATAFVVLLPTIKSRFPVELAQNVKTEQTDKILETGDVNVLDTITVTHDDGESYTLLYRDEALYLKRGDGDTEIVNESYTEEIVDAATEIAVTDTVAEDADEVSDQLADMGLEPPLITVNVGYANGYEVEFRVGAQVAGTTYHYYRWSGDNGVYMCDCGIYDAFEYTAHMLLPVQQPSITPALVDRVTLDTRVGGEMECSFEADGEDAYVGTLLAPYTYPMDGDAATALINALKNFRLGTKMDTVTSENRAQYGFDDPSAVLDVHQRGGAFSQVNAEGVLQTYTTEAQSIRLTLGAKDGEFFYYCEYAGECYRVSSFLVTTLVGADPGNYVSRAPANMGASNVASIVFAAGGGTLDVRATYTEHISEDDQTETDSDGNTVYDVTATADGEALSADSFNSLVQRLKEMTVSGKRSGNEPPSGNPLWTLTVTTADGAARTLAAYPQDAFNVLLAVDGVALHTLNDEAIRIALAELYPGV